MPVGRLRLCLGVGDAEVDRRVLSRGARLCSLAQRGYVVDPTHAAVAAGRRQRGVAAAARHVEHALPGTGIEGLHQPFAHGHHLASDLVEVALRPRLLLPRGHRTEIDSLRFRHDLPPQIRLHERSEQPCW